MSFAQAVEPLRHRRSVLHGVIFVAAFAVLLLSLACGRPGPQDTQAPDSARAAAPTDTYFENSHRVWEAARERGVTFRAVGQEPGWTLEIQGSSRITFATNYGADRISTHVPAPFPDPAAGTLTYHAVTSAHDLLITIRDVPCSDTMSGERFAMTVDVLLNGTTYRGCGRMLDRLPS